MDVEGPCGGNNAKGVGMALKGNSRDGMNISEVKDMEALVFSLILIISEFSGTEDKPALFPRLPTLALLPKITRLDDTFVIGFVIME